MTVAESSMPVDTRAATYQEALAKLAALQGRDVRVRPECATKLMSHGQKAERALVYFHGYTNCPQQFVALGAELFERGYNVLVPRLPYHGLADPLTTEQAKLTAKDLIRLTNDAVDIATGLGEHVTVMGLSTGGVMAGWAAQFRPDVDQALLIAPALGLPVVPSFVTAGVKRLAARLPNGFLWWDPIRRAKLTEPPHAYPRFSTHGLVQIYRVGDELLQAARRQAPVVRDLCLVTTALDMSVNNTMGRQLADLWQAHGAPVRRYEFPRSMKVFHDMIDPRNPFQRTSAVYPVLLDLLDGKTP